MQEAESKLHQKIGTDICNILPLQEFQGWSKTGMGDEIPK